MVFILATVSIAVSSCKKSDSLVNPGNIDNNDYFPSKIGSFYKYNFERTSPISGQTTGIRDAKYEYTNERGGIYTLQVDSVITSDSVFSKNSLFRKTDAGIYYFLDTTGFSANLPQEYTSFIPYLKIDPEMLLLSSPLNDGKKWPVFKVNLDQGIVVTVVDVEANYLGNENIAINLNSGTVTKPSVKIEYTFSLINPIDRTSQTVTVFGWFVADIGAVKWEGNGLLLNVFTRGEINFADSTSTGSENLIDYNIK
jgi:hypothetical protein